MHHLNMLFSKRNYLLIFLCNILPNFEWDRELRKKRDPET